MELSPQELDELTLALQPFKKELEALPDKPHLEIDGRVLIGGDDKDRHRERLAWLGSVDVSRKRVVDLGSQLGSVTFAMARQGAPMAIGVDCRPRLMKVAEAVRTGIARRHVSFQRVELKSVPDLTTHAGRAAVPPADIVLVLGSAGLLIGPAANAAPEKHEDLWLDLFSWLYDLAEDLVVLELADGHAQWLPFYEDALVEQGFEIEKLRIVGSERPVLFCKRGGRRPRTLSVGGRLYERVRVYTHAGIRYTVLEREGRRFLLKRFHASHLAAQHRPEDEGLLREAFAEMPQVAIPHYQDGRRLLLPHVDGRHIEVPPERQDREEPVEVSSPVLKLRIVSEVTALLARYFERKDALVRQFEHAVPTDDRGLVRSGEKMLIDVSPTKIMVADDGTLRFTGFEPWRPVPTREVLESLMRLLDGVRPDTRPFLQRFFQKR